MGLTSTFVEVTRSSDPRIYTIAGELIYALDGSLVLRLLSLFLTKIKGLSPFKERG